MVIVYVREIPTLATQTTRVSRGGYTLNAPFNWLNLDKHGKEPQVMYKLT